MSMRKPHDTLEVIQLEAVINDYISREIVQDATVLPLANGTPLLDTGVLDSLSLLRLVLFLQERFGIEVDDLDLIPEHFASVDAICAYLRSRAGGSAAQQAAVGEAATTPDRNPAQAGWGELQQSPR
jgi:acyl carrier protein